MEEKREQVIEVLARVSKKDRGAIQPEQELIADLGLDSPKQLQLLTELEERFKIQIEDDEAAKIETVGDVINFVIANA